MTAAVALPSVAGGGRSRLLTILVANGCAQLILAFATAWLTQRAFEGILSGAGATAETVRVTLLLPACALGIAFLRVHERVAAERVGQGFGNEVRLALFDHAIALPEASLQRRRHGSLVVRFVGDLKSLRLWASLGVARVLVASPLALGAVLALSWVSGWLGLAVALAMLGGVAAALLLSDSAQPAIREARKRQARLTGFVSERVSALAVVRMFGQTARERRSLESLGRNLARDAGQQAGRVAVLRATAEATGTLSVAAVLITGAWLATRGQCSPATIVAATTLVGLSAGAMRDLGQAHAYWVQGRVARQKLLEFLAQPRREVPVISGVLPEGPGRLVVAGVQVAGRLEGIDAHAEPGERVAIIGPNGSGKSTLMKVIGGIVVADAGRVLLDGVDVNAFPPGASRRAISMVSPTLPLWRGTVEYNIRYGWPDAPAERVAEVVAAVGLAGNVPELPLGLATVVAEGAKNFSSSLRKRIGLARALLSMPRVLLLDEVDTNMDATSLQNLDRALATYGGTVLMATHRIERAHDADRVWRMQAGRVVAAGSPSVVLTQDGDRPTGPIPIRPTAKQGLGPLA